jgi:ubiquinone/menaquinone biosynthesis C-methylase UbiE
MDRLTEIYSSKATQYHNLIAFEDVDGNLLPAIERVTPLKEKRILDLGTGTGRIPLLIKDMESQVVGIDLHWDMLCEQRAQRETLEGQWALVQGDMRYLPLESNCLDVITAGWSISNLRGRDDDAWKERISTVMNEIHRVVRPGGALVIVETMTTAGSAPAPPHEALAEYYAWIEEDWGFTKEIISTDYQFKSLEQAVESVTFFFGEELGEKVRDNNWERVPEWTGIWGKIAEK